MGMITLQQVFLITPFFLPLIQGFLLGYELVILNPSALDFLSMLISDELAPVLKQGNFTELSQKSFGDIHYVTIASPKQIKPRQWRVEAKDIIRLENIQNPVLNPPQVLIFK